MKYALLRGMFVWLLVIVAAPLGFANDVRFSQTLNAEEKKDAGLNPLSSDEIAVIDALVRRDTGTRTTTLATADNVAPAFSQRLTVDERRTSGLAKLSAVEVAKFDTLVERHQNAKLARSLLAPPSFVSRPTSRMTPVERKKEREVHGSFSLSYGMGSGGYSEKSGSMVLTLEDPARGFSISVGYTETHVKGGYGGYIYRDPLNDPLRGGPMDTVTPFRP